MSTNNIQSVYLDSQFLYAYVSGSTKDNEKTIADEVRAVIHNRNTGIQIVIPFVVIGEAVNKIKMKLNPDCQEKAFQNLSLILDENRVDTKPPIIAVFSMALELMNKDRELKGTDALIRSQALCDKTATHLLSGDTVLLNSQVINQKCKEWRTEEGYRNLIIRDSF